MDGDGRGRGVEHSRKAEEGARAVGSGEAPEREDAGPPCGSWAHIPDCRAGREGQAEPTPPGAHRNRVVPPAQKGSSRTRSGGTFETQGPVTVDTEVEKEGLQSSGWQMDMPRGRRSRG